MPGRYYMEVDYRLDHSFRVPRPDLSVRFDSPNACNDCHQDRSAEWAAAAVSRWYGDERPEHHSETWLQADSLGHEAIPELAALLNDTAQNAIVRATTAWYLGQFPTEESLSTLAGFIRDPHPLVRNSAVRAISNLSPEERQHIPLEYALEDPVRSVRIGAARGLLHLDPMDISSRLRSELAAARKEYTAYLYLNQYFPQGRMNLGQYYESIGEGQKAIEAYEKAIETDGYFNAARMNLAYLYNQAGENNQAAALFEKVISQEPDFGPAYYYLALLKAEQEDLEGALPYFTQAAERMPDNPRVQYNRAISFQQLGMPEKAEEAYLSALRISPGNPDFLYGLCTLYIQQRKYDKALPYVKQLTDGSPQNPQFRQMEEMIRSHLN